MVLRRAIISRQKRDDAESIVVTAAPCDPFFKGLDTFFATATAIFFSQIFTRRLTRKSCVKVGKCLRSLLERMRDKSQTWSVPHLLRASAICKILLASENFQFSFSNEPGDNCVCHARAEQQELEAHCTGCIRIG